MSTPVAPAQIQLALMPNGPANPPLLDMATEAPPEFYAGGDVAFLLAMFDQFGNVLDASSLSALTLSLYDDPTTMNLLASVATITFTATVTLDAWRNAAAQQAIALLTAAQMAAIDFAGQPELRAWMVLEAATKTGAKVALGAGWVTLHAGAPGAVLLPLYPVPSVIPIGTIYLIPAGVTITFPTSPKILGDLVLAPAENGLPAGNFKILNP